MSRKSFSRKERDRLFALNGGECHICHGLIQRQIEAFEIEHEIPWEISRDDSDANLKLAHVGCHSKKTARDRKDIAHVHRMAANYNGSKPRKPKSKWKRKISGQVVLREADDGYSRAFPSRELWGASHRDDTGD